MMYTRIANLLKENGISLSGFIFLAEVLRNYNFLMNRKLLNSFMIANKAVLNMSVLSVPDFFICFHIY